MLRFILGRSGYGKTEYLRSMLADMAREGEERLLMLVPDQISFETETAFLDLLGPALCSRIRVLGFSRLCDYVFELTGSRTATFADDGVRHVVMSLALEQVSDSLDLFKKRASAFDLCDLMLTAVKEYKKCAITSDMLRECAGRCSDETLQKKLIETALVYDAYDALMARSYMDPLDSLTRVSKLLETNGIFDGYTIAVDAFYGFTSQEYEVLERLMCSGRDMYVALCEDGADGSDTDVFFVPRRTRSRLTRMAKDNGVAIATPVYLTEQKRFKAPELAALEENVYRYDKTVYEAPAEGVHLYRAADVYDECDFVARSIRKLIEGGMRYGDIAVIARSADRYSGILDTCFEKYGISYFMNRPENIDAYPLVRLVTAAFDVITRRYDRDDVLTLLKTGLCGYSVSEIADFENYIYIWDISNKELCKPFTANPRGFSDNFTEDDRKSLATVETLRADVIGKLRDFEFSCRDTNGKGIAHALMRLLYALHCDRHIDALCDELEAQRHDDLAADLIRIWNVLCEILDKMVAVLGDYPISARRFAELLYAHFANTEVASIPRGADQVDVATADRALIPTKRAVFLIGAVDGEFPHTPVEAGVFTDSERHSLRALSLPVSDSIEELFTTEKYYAYSALTCSSERVYVSYYAADLSGVPTVPSTIVSELFSVFKKASHSEYDALPIAEHLYSEGAAFDYLAAHYRRRSSEIAALKAYFSDKEGYADIIRSIEQTIHRPERRIHETELSRKLFREHMTLSSSQVDRFHLCRFSYFCRYGLSIKERKKATIDALEYGTLMHYVMEEFFRAHRDDDYTALSREMIITEVGEIIDGYAERHLGGMEDKSERFRYLFYRIKSTAVNLVAHIVEELRQSDFRPADFELSIGEDIPAYTISLPDGGEVRICGSVDRVDCMQRDGVDYIRIIDYKTGTKKFNLSDILYGINLQMLIYMSAIESGGKLRYGENIIPAGVLYMPAVSPTVAAEYTDDPEKLSDAVSKKLTMHGIVLDDPDVLSAMEHDGAGRYIPVTVKGDTISAGADNLASLEQMGAIFRRIDVLISQMATALREGEIADVPAKGVYDACEWCPYMAVCTHREDDPSREIEKRGKAEVYAELCKDGDEDE